MKRASYLVVITGIKEGSTANAIKGIRNARIVLGDRLGSQPKRVASVVADAEKSETYILGSHDDLSIAQEAAQRCETDSNGCVLVEVRPNPENAPSDAGVSAEPKVYKVEVCADCGHETSTLLDGPDACQHAGESEFKECVLLDDLDGLIGVPYSWEAIALAVITLTTCNGSPSAALTAANTYALHAPETWDEVGEFYEAVFPVDPHGGPE